MIAVSSCFPRSREGREPSACVRVWWSATGPVQAGSSVSASLIESRNPSNPEFSNVLHYPRPLRRGRLDSSLCSAPPAAALPPPAKPLTDVESPPLC